MISLGNKKKTYYFCLEKAYIFRVMSKKKNRMKGTGKAYPKKPTIDAVRQRHNNEYIAVLYIVTSAVVLSFVWGVIRWGWISLDILQNAKSFVPDFVVPALFSALHLYLCRHFVAAIRDKIEDYVFWGIFVFSFILFASTSLYVEKLEAKSATVDTVEELKTINVDGIDFVKIHQLSKEDMDSCLYGFFVGTAIREKRHGSDIEYTMYEVCGLKNNPNTYICYEHSKRHGYSFASKSELKSWFYDIRDAYLGSLFRVDMNGHYIKRLNQKDNIEGYQRAVENSMRTKIDWSVDKSYTIYKVLDDKDPMDAGFNAFMWFLTLLLGGIALLIVFWISYIRQEFDESVSKRPGLITIIRAMAGDVKEHGIVKLEFLLLWALPVVMIVVFALMLLNGYSLDSSNRQLMIDWGGLSNMHVLVHHEWWRLITYGFLHDGLFHIVGNVFMYAICASMLSASGHRDYRIVVIFMLSAVLSGLSILFFCDSHSMTVGASGGVFGMLSFWFVDEIRAYFVWKYQLVETGKKAKNKLTYNCGFLIPGFFLGLNIFTSFQNGVSLSGHLGGASAGILIFALQFVYLELRKE